MSLPDMPQSNKQHPVPQNIMDVEFKLIGDLTMRQFTYLFVLGIMAYLSYLVVYGLFKWPLVISLCILGLGLAFVPVEERGLDEWIVNFFKAINTPTQKIWKKEPQLPTAFLYDNLAVVKQEMITLAPTSSRRKLEEYLRNKSDDGNEDPLDIPERDYAMKVRQAYPDTPMLPQGLGVGVIVDEPIISFKEQDFPRVPLEDEKVEEEKEKIEIETKKEDKENKDTDRQAEDRVKVQVGAQKRNMPVSNEIMKGKVSDYRGFELPKRFESREANIGYSPITPDMHSGRKFVNLVPSHGELVLPIRGERMLKTSDDSNLEEGLDAKAKKLNELLEKIRREEGIEKSVSKKVSQPPIPVEKKEEDLDIKSKAKGLADELRGKNENLEDEIQRLKDQIKRGKSMSLNTDTQEQLLKRLESQKEKIVSSYSDLRKQFQELQKKLEEKNTPAVDTGFSTKVKRVIPSLTNDPNVVTGVVRDSGDKLLSGVLLIVKNMRGEAVRAIKTNSLGQFIVSTPLQNGAYTVEVSPSNKINVSFGIIPIEVKGEVIQPLDIVGK